MRCIAQSPPWRHFISIVTACLIVMMPVLVLAADLPPVELKESKDNFVLSNGRVAVTLDKSRSTITSLRHADHEFVGTKGIYYSMGGGKSYRQPSKAAIRIVKQSPELVDIAFLQKWKRGEPQAVDIEIHYALKRGESGVYSYAILTHPADYPESSVAEWRIVWGMPQLDKKSWLMEKIRVDPARSWEMPTPEDLATAKPTGIKEIVELTSGIRAGKFDCKYDYNLEYYSTGCWGFASDRNKVGAWIVLGSHEYFNDGPTKQDLSSASGIIHLHFGMNHYNGSSTRLEAGRDWKKVYGPFLLHVNSGGNADELWRDARAKATTERQAWPYAWVDLPELYPPAAARGTVRGSLLIHDPLKPQVNAGGAWVGLAQPGPGGNWQMESNNYQYWTKADAMGNFVIPQVRPGTYTLSAFTTGAVGEYTADAITVQAGANDAGKHVWTVPRLGKSLAWEIGVPDRRAEEFRHGDDYFRGYLWGGFAKEFANPLVYEIGKSNPARDWNFAQGSYLVNDKIVAWPWDIRFNLPDIPATGNARLQIAIASADRRSVNIEVNGKWIKTIDPPASGGNALLREAIHAKYGHCAVDFPATMLHSGANTIRLSLRGNRSPAEHVMYDSIALELP